MDYATKKQAHKITSYHQSSGLTETVGVLATRRQEGMIGSDGMQNVELYPRAEKEYKYTEHGVSWLR